MTSETADALNLIGYCDLTTWNDQNALDVTGHVCGDYQQLGQNQPVFQILNLERNALRFGELTADLNGRSVQKRPIVFGLDFLKQP